MKRLIYILILLFGFVPAWAQIAFVNGQSGSADGAATTIACAAQNTTTGNLLAIWIAGVDSTDTVTSIADTASNTYVQCPSSRATSAAVGFSDIWYAKNITGNASNTTTATITSSTFRRIACLQYSGAHTTTPQETAQTGTAASPATSVTSGSFSPAASGNVNVVGVVTSQAETYTAGTNYALQTAPSVDTQTEDRLNAPSGAQTASMSGNTASDWLISVCSFKPAAAGAQPPTNKMDKLTNLEGGQ